MNMQVCRMDSDSSGNYHFVSASDVVEAYYSMVKKMYKSTALDKQEEFNGSLAEEDMLMINDYAQKIGLHLVSQALIEYLVLMELFLEKAQSEVCEVAIYNCILRLEKALAESSAWEIFNPEGNEVLLEDLTDFEATMVEKIVSAYVETILGEQLDLILFFPLPDLSEPKVVVRLRILEKVASVKIVPHKSNYLQKLKDGVKCRLKAEVSDWLQHALKDIKLVGTTTILDDMKCLIRVLQELNNMFLTSTNKFSLFGCLFGDTSCCYWKLVLEVLDLKLFKISKDTMKIMDTYQTAHRNFHVNMKDSCTLCHRLYLELKQLVQMLETNAKMNDSSLRLWSIGGLFQEAFFHLLYVLQVECHLRIGRAVQAEERDTIMEVERGKIYSSTVIIMNCMITVLDELKRLELVDKDMNITFLIKVTDVICDGAKIFSEALANRADSIDLDMKESDYLQKVCALGNSIKHIMEFLSQLSQTMLWEYHLEVFGDSDASYRREVRRILDQILESMLSDLKKTFQAIYRHAILRVYGICTQYLNSWLTEHVLTRYQNVERFLAFLDDQLHVIHDVIDESELKWFLGQLWTSILEHIKSGFQEGKSPDYSRKLQKNIEAVYKYFTELNAAVDECKNMYNEFHETLILNSKSTVELELNYYQKLANIQISPGEYLGHLALQVGCKQISSGTADVQIQVQKGQRLPVRKFNINTLKAKVELCPKVIFPTFQPQTSHLITKELQNPVFNETFLFCGLPLSVLKIEGAVILVQIVNQDATYFTEVVYPLNCVQNMSGLSSLDFLPVHLITLRYPDTTQPSFQHTRNTLLRWNSGWVATTCFVTFTKNTWISTPEL